MGHQLVLGDMLVIEGLSMCPSVRCWVSEFKCVSLCVCECVCVSSTCLSLPAKALCETPCYPREKGLTKLCAVLANCANRVSVCILDFIKL